ncbi:MAG: type I-E CRISPR-associated protein Cse2/CasB [Candidatus Thiodiazotropha sp. 6PDIVS]
MSVNFGPDSPVGEILKSFWEGLENNKGERAELRRCKQPEEVVMIASFHQLCMRLKPFMKSEGKGWEMRIAAIAGLLAHVQASHHQTLAKQMAELRGGSPAVSELRFRRLLQRDRRELFGALIRMLGLLNKGLDKRVANIHDMAKSVYYWGDSERKRWAFEYFPNVPEKKLD